MSSDLLPYDLSLLLTSSQGAGVATFQRDYGQGDGYGGEGVPDWQTLSSVKCVLVWNKSTGVRSANKVYVSPDRRVPISEGMLAVPQDTDVTENDRVSQFVDFTGTVLIEGYFTITAVLDQETHGEIYFERMRLGG